MAQITPNLNLTVWNLASDTYNHEELANNFIALDQHDHSGSGKGAQLDGAKSIKDGTIPVSKLGAGILSSTNIGQVIQEGAINTTQIANEAITTEKLADSLAPNYADGVTSPKIANSAIITSKIQNNAVTSAKLASDSTNDSSRAVTSNHIKNGAVTEDKIASGAISATKIQTGALARTVGSTKIGALPLYTSGSSLPTSATANAGDELLYAPASNENTAVRNVIWHLRWSDSLEVWQFAGGAPLYQANGTNFESYAIPGSNPNYTYTPRTDYWYRRWPTKTSEWFNYVKIPLPGAYAVTYSATLTPTNGPNGVNDENVYGVWATGISVGDPNNDISDQALPESGLYQTYNKKYNAPTSINGTMKIDVATDKVSNLRFLSQVFNISSANSKDTINNTVYSRCQFTINAQYIAITPIYLTNWT